MVLMGGLMLHYTEEGYPYAGHYKSRTDRTKRENEETHQALLHQKLWGCQEHNVSTREIHYSLYRIGK